MEFRRSLVTRASLADAFAYLADFTNTVHWDPGTVHTVLESGNGGIGSTYRNVSRFLGRETELTYVVVDRLENARFALRGYNKTSTVHDTMTFGPTARGGTQVVYQAEFDFNGMARLLGPVVAPALRRLVDSASETLLTALDGLAT